MKTDMQLARKMYGKTPAAIELRQTEARKIIARGVTKARGVQAEMLSRFGISVGIMTLRKMTGEDSMVAEAPPVAEAMPAPVPSSDLRDLLAVVLEMRGDCRRAFGAVAALRYEMQRLADDLGAPKQTAAMRSMRESLPGANGATTDETPA